MSSLMTYIKESHACRSHYSSGPAIVELARDFTPWRRSQKPGRSPLNDALPWITFPAIRFLQSRLTPQAVVFEYGSGGSTIFCARRAKHVYSIEHDASWWQLVTQRMAALNLHNWTGELIATDPVDDRLGPSADPSDPLAYGSGSTCDFDVNRTFRNYVRAIDRHADASLDVILIDGRARPACFLHALPKLRPGGCILWDNTDRSYYHPAMKLGANLDFLDFPGPAPYTSFFTRTTAFLRR